MIKLTYGGQFEENELINFIKLSGRDYIIQGQQACSFANHSKPHSLDYWLRKYAVNPDTKQADNTVIEALEETKCFKVVMQLHCPDKGTYCKGLRLI